MSIKKYLAVNVFSPIRKFNDTRLKVIKYKNKNKLLFAFYYLKYYRYQIKYSIQIPYSTIIGDHFAIGHYGGIVINKNAILGEHVRIMNGILIGEESRGKRKGSPVIGNNVFIGTNAIIVGKVTIGNDVLIAPNSYVNFDVPDHSIVIGNPAKIIHKENASLNYVD